jgi:hypothetical protein
MDLASYKARNRKTLTLPSGLECTIKKLTVADVYAMGGAGSSESDQLRQSVQMVSKCVTGPFRIVDKPAQETQPDELSVTDIDNDDFAFLIEQITEFSGLAEKKISAVAN